MKNSLSKGYLATIIVFVILSIDQVLKIWVKTHMVLHQDFPITNWFHIWFVENNGMAFGMEIFGKLFLSIFRIFAVVLLIFYIYRCIKNHLKTGYIICIAMIVAGAAGNIIDSLCYGFLFSDSTVSTVATFLPINGGYAAPLFGRVVDMFYFPLVQWNWPQWIPFIGGNHFIFFSPIFNFADASISCGIIAILLFYNKYLHKQINEKGKKS
ncbi:MAG: lipoprotein signal peptidase [Bacteroidaceae bacterium]